VVEGTPLLRAQTSKGSRGFESHPLRHPAPWRASGGRPPGARQGAGWSPQAAGQRRETGPPCGPPNSSADNLKRRHLIECAGSFKTRLPSRWTPASVGGARASFRYRNSVSCKATGRSAHESDLRTDRSLRRAGPVASNAVRSHRSRHVRASEAWAPDAAEPRWHDVRTTIPIVTVA